MTALQKYLETYSLEEIFEINDVTEEEVLEFLLKEDFLSLPPIRPVDLQEND